MAQSKYWEFTSHPDWDIMQKKNYWDTLNKMQAILAKWSNRSLSIPGKITMVNSLLSSMLVYKFLALPTPDRSFFTEYKTMITEYIWDKKIPKIRYNKLIQDYCNNGLKLVDLEAKNHALKAAWAIRWAKKNTLDSNKWVYFNLPIKDHRIWLCNLETKDLENYFIRKMDMGTQILKSWSILHYSCNFGNNIFYNCPLWFNSNIRRANKPFFHLKLLESNICTLADIWNFQSKRVFTYPELQERHGNAVDMLTSQTSEG